MAVERDELQLVWPPALFASEAGALLESGADDDALGGLLAEAFHGDRGEQLLQHIARAHPYHPADDDPWALPSGFRAPDPGPFTQRATAVLVAELRRDAGELLRYVPRLLFRQRQQLLRVAVLTVAETKDQFARLVVDLCALGYFEDAFGSECDDSRDDPAGQGQRLLAGRLEVDLPLWPLHEWSNGIAHLRRVQEQWPDEVLFDVVEALDELVARPHQRCWHGHHQGWDYSDFARQSGQAVYRWKVNDLFDRSVVPLRLAESGTDAGQLVHAAGDPRDELVERALVTPEDHDRVEVRHAVELFRGRTASREDKRSAVSTLFRVLESRRGMLKQELLRADEGALFRIANEFDVRHRDGGRRPQHSDYDDAFMDWVFWWCLGTVELTNRLLDRPPLPAATAFAEPADR